MNSKRFVARHRWALAGVAVLVAAAGIVGIARAVIPDGGVLHVCFNGTTGALRAVDSSSSCRGAEAGLDLYTRSGADNAFLGRTATAANSDALGGTPASAYVKSGTAAGGDLTGTFPNPTLQRPLDADTLHGRPYWAYAQGDGAVIRGEAQEIQFGDTAHFDIANGELGYHCSSNPGGDDTVTFSNPFRGLQLPGFVEDGTGISYHVFENGHPEDFTVAGSGGRVVIETMADPFLESGTARVEIRGAHDAALAGAGSCVVAIDAIETKTILHS
jgi:hypothetical protein